MFPMHLLAKGVLAGMALQEGARAEQQARAAASMDQHAQQSFQEARDRLRDVAQAVIWELEGLGSLRLDIMQRRLGQIEQVSQRIPGIADSKHTRLLNRLTRMKLLCAKAAIIMHDSHAERVHSALIGVGAFGAQGACEEGSGSCCIMHLVKRIKANTAIRWLVQGVTEVSEQKHGRWMPFGRRRRLEKALIQTFLDRSEQAQQAMQAAQTNLDRSDEAVQDMRDTVHALTKVGHAASEMRDMMRQLDVRLDLVIQELEQAARPNNASPGDLERTLRALDIAASMLHLAESPLLDPQWQISEHFLTAMQEGETILHLLSSHQPKRAKPNKRPVMHMESPKQQGWNNQSCPLFLPLYEPKKAPDGAGSPP
ncbi:hypothetical protein Mmc1_3541 [Magnetococcus marinus MC-1]|uniref:Uncharacterized protein n=1 Tax=Magnetococcus marinus (strain ATCC BAA-1437 / JCM 17883 / MC-1) TaxID=156889 RepID=A0LDI3_MAGMM|nr:hypothetical protein [Magnetococcus marinus]ABK46026.1 hypothetical protein Mmc1_3541 [Magnetococcus marinus MC-1]